MKKNIKDLWVSALLSGKYKQGRKRLKNGNRYCCLGVLCELYRLDFPKTRKWENDEYMEDDNLELSTKVQTWAGLNFSSPRVQLDGLKAHLANLNDGKGKFSTFKAIAKLIKDQF